MNLKEGVDRDRVREQGFMGLSEGPRAGSSLQLTLERNSGLKCLNQV